MVAFYINIPQVSYQYFYSDILSIFGRNVVLGPVISNYCINWMLFLHFLYALKLGPSAFQNSSPFDSTAFHGSYILFQVLYGPDCDSEAELISCRKEKNPFLMFMPFKSVPVMPINTE
jgi:hypothetical protein